MATNLREEIHQLHAQLCNGLADPIRILILYSRREAFACKRTCPINQYSPTNNFPTSKNPA